MVVMLFFFFKQKTAYEMRISDWSSDVCSSDLVDQHTGAVVPPIHPSTTFARDNKYELVGGIRYGRYGNPSWSHVESMLAKLDAGKEARVFGSGLAACSAVLETIKAGQHILTPKVMK